MHMHNILGEISCSGGKKGNTLLTHIICICTSKFKDVICSTIPGVDDIGVLNYS